MHTWYSDSGHTAERLETLLEQEDPIRPDWDGIAELLAIGAPIDGRTTVRGMRRLRPWETLDEGGAVTTERWSWLDLESGGGSVDAVVSALEATVADHASNGFAPLLSGGWDSRILATLAVRASPADRPVTVRTTSSDTGTVLEELVAAQVAERLGAHHKILMPRRDRFAPDLALFASAVDFQTAFHIWLVPAVEDLDPAGGTVVDGLGGGVVLGGAFADPSGRGSLLDRRFAATSPYLGDAGAVLCPAAVTAVTDRARAGFDALATPLLGHRHGATWTAYLARTLPGISLAPYGLVSAKAPVATPYLDDRVVAAAMAVEDHTDGRLYPEVMGRLDPVLATLPTAAELTPWPRPHPRRISSAEAAGVIRDLVLAPTVRPLIDDALAGAPLERWMAVLATRGGQHLLRGLAVLALWFDRWADRLGGVDTEGLLR